MEFAKSKDGTARLVRRGRWQHKAWWSKGNELPVPEGGDVAFYEPVRLK
jgi:hypothetical protein